MRKFAKVLKITGVIAGVICAGILIGWLASGGKPNLAHQPIASAPAPEPPGPEHSNHSSLVDAGFGKHTVEVAARPSPAPPPPPSVNLITNWEDRLDQILAADTPEADKAKEMLAMFPRLPEKGQEEMAQHLSNLTADEDYGALGQYLTNSTLAEPVLDVLLADLLNRPNSLKLPLLYEIARQGPDQNPKAGDAKDILELYLDGDYGDDWTTWQANMQQWLKDNPD